MAARIAELGWLRDRTPRANLADTIAALLSLAEAGDALNSPTSMKEARLARLDAHRLWDRLEMEEARGPLPIDKELTEEAWITLYGAPAPMTL